MKLYVVRHGQTNWNIENRLQGSVDIPLNDTGIKQAHLVASQIKPLPIDVIISSPLSRALETAKIINEKKSLPLLVDSAILERNYGILEGIYGTDYNQNLYWDFNKNYTYENVEPIQSFFLRIHSFLNNAIQIYSDKNVLLVTHSGVNIAINCYFNNLPSNKKLLDIQLDNCSYSEYNSDTILGKNLCFPSN